MIDGSTRSHVVEALKAGTLPRQAARALVGAYGTGIACDVCGQPTSPETTTYRMRLGSGAKARSAYMHCRCFEIWDELRRSTVEGSCDTE